MQQAPQLAAYATDPAKSRGRLHVEAESATRTAFQRDRDRIIHCAAFRRLMYKTQVFVNHEGDHFRTRLTHSLEVAQIARSVSRSLGLNEDLAEALALAHDLGHPPFGHAGEEALNGVMQPFGGFDHNAQTLRVLTKLERRYAEFDGLNLTWETLEGVVKHNGPLLRPGQTPAEADLPAAITAYVRDHDLGIATFPGAEAQVAALADDIAYNNHDIDDGLRAGLFAIDDLGDVPVVGPIIAEVRARYPDLEPARLIYESVRRIIDVMVNDLRSEAERRIGQAAPRSVEDIRALDHPVVAFSADLRDKERDIKAFLFERMYRHDKLKRMAGDARKVVRTLFDLYMEQPERLPAGWSRAAETADRDGRARLIADYIAGMTDRYALDEHHRLLDTDATTN